MAHFALLLLSALVGGAQVPAPGYLTTSDGVRLYYQVIGRGADTIIAAHGGPGETLANLYPALNPLTRRHTLIVYDQRGNGRSSFVDDSTRISIEHHLADLEAIRNHFKIDKPVLLGHSWGGDLVALYAARYPSHVARIVMVDPGPPRHDPFDAQSAKGRMAGFDSLGKVRIGVLVGAIFADTAKDKPALCRTFFEFYLRNYYVDKKKLKEAVALDCGYPGYTLIKANRVSRLTERSGFSDRSMWDTLVRQVRAPTLVIHGAEDFIPVASSATWARGFPEGRLLVIERSSHSPFSDRPDVFFPAVEEFLAGRWPSGAERPAAR